MNGAIKKISGFATRAAAEAEAQIWLTCSDYAWCEHDEPYDGTAYALFIRNPHAPPTAGARKRIDCPLLHLIALRATRFDWGYCSPAIPDMQIFDTTVRALKEQVRARHRHERDDARFGIFGLRLPDIELADRDEKDLAAHYFNQDTQEKICRRVVERNWGDSGRNPLVFRQKLASTWPWLADNPEKNSAKPAEAMQAETEIGDAIAAYAEGQSKTEHAGF